MCAYKLVPLRRFVEDLIDGPFGSSLTGSHYSDEGARVIRLGNIGEARFKSDDEAYISMEHFAELRRHSVESGDLLIAGLGDSGNPVGRACLAPEGIGPAIVKADCFRARLDERRLSHRFAVWALNSKSVGQQVLTLTRGSTRARINLAMAKAIQIPIPPLEEQCRIAGYLDRETARIDILIAEQQRLIEMLRERRVATVAEALDGHEMTRLRRLVDPNRPMTYGILQCGEPVVGGVPYIGPSDITGEGLSPERDALRTTTPEIAGAYRRSILAGGDVVVSIGPAYGKIAVVSVDLAGANLTQDTVRVALRPDLADSRFVVWALLSRQTFEYWDHQIMGATFRRLNLGTLARTPIPLISIDEQRRIARYLDEQTARIDTLIAETERFIELSRERRAALITVAVTGQIEVGEMV